VNTNNEFRSNPRWHILSLDHVINIRKVKLNNRKQIPTTCRTLYQF
jgi:hypothetical protein